MKAFRRHVSSYLPYLQPVKARHTANMPLSLQPIMVEVSSTIHPLSTKTVCWWHQCLSHSETQMSIRRSRLLLHRYPCLFSSLRSPCSPLHRWSGFQVMRSTPPCVHSSTSIGNRVPRSVISRGLTANRVSLRFGQEDSPVARQCVTPGQKDDHSLGVMTLE